MDAAVSRKLRTLEAAAYVGISGSTLSKWRMTGDGPVYAKIGRIVVYDIHDLNAWVRDRMRRSTSEHEA